MKSPFKRLQRQTVSYRACFGVTGKSCLQSSWFSKILIYWRKSEKGNLSLGRVVERYHGNSSAGRAIVRENANRKPNQETERCKDRTTSCGGITSRKAHTITTSLCGLYTIDNVKMNCHSLGSTIIIVYLFTLHNHSKGISKQSSSKRTNAVYSFGHILRAVATIDCGSSSYHRLSKHSCSSIKYNRFAFVHSILCPTNSLLRTFWDNHN